MLRAVVYRHAQNVRRKQIAGELDAPERQSQSRGKRLRERGLADTGYVYDQQMPARERARKRLPHGSGFTDDDHRYLLFDAQHKLGMDSMLGQRGRRYRMRGGSRHHTTIARERTCVVQARATAIASASRRRYHMRHNASPPMT